MAGRGKGGKGIGRGKTSDDDEDENKRSRAYEEDSDYDDDCGDCDEEDDSQDEEETSEELRKRFLTYKKTFQVREMKLLDRCPANDAELRERMLQYAAADPEFIIAKDTLVKVAVHLNWLSALLEKEPGRGEAIVNRNIHELKKSGKFVNIDDKNPPIYRLCLA